MGSHGFDGWNPQCGKMLGFRVERYGVEIEIMVAGKLLSGTLQFAVPLKVCEMPQAEAHAYLDAELTRAISSDLLAPSR